MTRARLEARLWLVQRASAGVLAVCLLVHLATILYAVRGGLSAAEILGRTRGSLVLAGFYNLFVIAVALHAPLGLRAILRETQGWRGPRLDGAMLMLALFLAWSGWRAIAGLTG